MCGKKKVVFVHLRAYICGCIPARVRPRARPRVDAVFVCTHEYEHEPLAVIHREDMLTGLATSERIGKKPPGALCACVCVCVRAHACVLPAVCVCVCVRSH